MFQSIICAFQLLTIVPIPSSKKAVDEDRLKRVLSNSVAWYPLTGLFIGAVIYGALQLFLLTNHHQTCGMVCGAIVLALWIALTGGLHLDGLIDSCDGLLCAKSSDQRLLIMKDTHVGAFGVVGAIVVLLLKFAALSEMSTNQFLMILIIPVISRMCMSLSVIFYKTARNNTGMGSMFKAQSGWPQALIAVCITLTAAYGFCGLSGLILIGIALLSMLMVNAFILKRINGLTGDTYGALNEIIETILLIVISLKLNRIFI